MAQWAKPVQLKDEPAASSMPTGHTTGTDDAYGRRLLRLRWAVLGLVAFYISVRYLYHYLRGDSLLESLVEWAFTIAFSTAVIVLVFRLVGRLQGRLQHEIAERRQVEGALRQRNLELELLNRSTKTLNSSLDLDQVLTVVLEEMRHLLDATACSIWLIDAAEEELVCQQSAGPHSELVRGWRLPLGQGLVGQVALSGESEVVSDTRADERHFRGVDERTGLALCSVLTVPLKVKGHIIGVLQVGHTQGDRFKGTDLALAESLALTAAGAIENARLYERTRGELAQRKQAEEALRESQQQYHDLVENVNDVIYALRADGVMTFVSQAVEAMLGYNPSEMVGGHFADFIHPEDVPRATESFQRILSGHSVSGEYRLLAKSGETRWMRTSSRPTFVEERVVGIQGVLSDISEQKLLEAQFLQAQKMEAVGRLAGGVAHDFNNLLTMIMGYVEFVLDALPQESPAHDDLAQIKRAGERGASLVRQLLAFSRKQVLEPRVLDLNATIGNMQKMLQRLLGEDVELVVELEPSLGKVKADPVQVEQVIMNLAVNARDAMPEGGRLTLETTNVVLDRWYARTHLEAQPGRHVVLTVRDTGVGMDHETKSHLFEPFFTTKEAGEGTGLGRATVYGIVRQSGGYIEVQSDLGVGTAFRIYLPRIDEEIFGGSEKALLAQQLQGTETILVVEDDVGVGEMACRALMQRGYRVLGAHSPKEALALAQEYAEPIHLLVTDVVMPYMNGRELADRLTSMRPGIKVLYLSGYTDEALGRRGILEPGLALLRKPFRSASLAQRVREVLDNSH
jgi:two-component system cell cycle sensor histidine kinase/response regulator CckA